MLIWNLELVSKMVDLPTLEIANPGPQTFLKNQVVELER